MKVSSGECDSIVNWYAVHTKPRQESAAEQNLQRQGFVTYAPKMLLRKCKRGIWTKVVEPLFPRYLFIQVDLNQQSLAPVRSTPGVAALVRFGQQLRPTPDTVIAYLKNSENAETHQHHFDDWPHRPGDTVEVLAGPFAGLTGVLQTAAGDDRALLLVDLLGRQSSVCLAMDVLAVAT